MADDTNAQLWRSMGIMEGRQDGQDKRQDQQHQEIVALRDDIAAVRSEMQQGFKETTASMLQCFAEQEKRLAAIIGHHVSELGSVPGFDLGSALKKPQVIGPISGGLGAIIVIVLQYLQSHP